MKEAILAALRKFARQRPGLDFANYGDIRPYRADMRQITRDLAHAQALLAAVERSGIDAEAILRAADNDRLSITVDGENVRIDFCTCQYRPVEYRKGVCRVLASALWAHRRDCQFESVITGATPGDRLRASFRREFGPAIADRYFN
jgi:hypothetical protein